ncbi:CatB-related O-acetyltransferase [Salidesulfovibrio brasiliensis]|uniref:CatB-related O-acetyltransferase n=1 Tax=Salidesulfovibrio brasiliensis TaxID=221711 RepID=UPI0009F81468|nr:DapH/DapD/GlmU-related protein [Salidesulfovibrio brasiliensis]
MFVTEYTKMWRLNERNTILKGFLPSGFWRLLQYIGYRRRYPEAYVSGDSDIHKNAVIGSGCYIWSAFLGETVTLGRCCTVGVQARLGGTATVNIGSFCSIAQNSFIFSRNHNYSIRTTSALHTFSNAEIMNPDTPDFIRQPIEIGNDVWIGRDTKILAGATIPDGCVIGAGSVVTRNTFEPYSILAGVPARPVGKRFSDKVVDELLSLQWWNEDMNTIFSDEMIRFLMSAPDED